VQNSGTQSESVRGDRPNRLRAELGKSKNVFQSCLRTHPSFSTRRPSRMQTHRRQSGIGGRETILYSLQYTAVHIVESERIWWEGTDGRRAHRLVVTRRQSQAASISIGPGISILMAGSWTPGVSRCCSRARGIFIPIPPRLTGDTYAQSRAHP
jgi:hypothetical protein